MSPDAPARSPRLGLPISLKVTALILVTVVLVLGVGLWVLRANDVERLRSHLLHETEAIARLVSDYSVAAVAFDAPDEATRDLALLQSEPAIVSAALYDRHGNRFARWAREGPAPELPVRLAPAERDRAAQFGAHEVRVTTPVLRDGERFGTLVLVASTQTIEENIDDYQDALLGLGGGLVLLALLCALALQRVVSRPILALAGVADAISASADTTLRVAPQAGRELARLSVAFNRMLGTIEEREQARDRAVAAERRLAERLRFLHEVDRAILDAQPTGELAAMALAGVRASLPCGRGEAYLNLASSGLQADEALMARLARGEAAWRDGTLTVPLVDRGAAAAGPLLGVLVLGEIGTGVERAEVEEVAGQLAERLVVSLRQARLTAAVARYTEELESRVRDRTAALEERNRELETFAYSVAHDLRAPLRAMQGFGEGLLRRAESDFDAEALMYVRRIVAASVRMDALIRDLLDYSRLALQAIDLAPLDLGAVLLELQSQLAEECEHRGAELTVLEPLGRVIGHRLTLLQVLGNLATNALKFVAPGVRPRVVIRAEPRGDRLRLWVEDNGIGIAPEHRERIFLLFERLHGREAYPGTGLGLAIAKKGMDRMGGTIGLESAPGEGSRFWIELPAAR